MRNYNISSQSQPSDVQAKRDRNDRQSDGNKNRFNKNHNNDNNNNSNNKGERRFEKRRDNDRQEQKQQQSHERHQSQGDRDRSSHRDRSGQRGGQHPDSSMSRDGGAGLLGSIKFTPGYPTRELPPIETKADPSKRFTGRCRLFVGNLPHNTTEEQVKNLFEPFGEVGEVYLGPKSAFAFVKMDTRQNAELARDNLDCSSFDGRTIRVRLAAHAAAIRVKHLSPVVTNELLAYAFRYFGEIERAVVVVDDKGKSIGEGIVEYSRKQSAQFAVKRCQQECFILTQEFRPVLVEPYDQHDEDEGLPEKSINKNSIEYKEQRDVGPRFAEQGTFEHSYALRWKELYQLEKQKRDLLEQEILEARRNLQDQIEICRLEHNTMQLQNQLQQLENNKLKLQQMKDQVAGTAQQRDEQRRQQELMLRQREEDILRRQQMSNQNFLGPKEPIMRAQPHSMQEMSSSTDGPSTIGDQNEQQQQQTYQPSSNTWGQETDQNNLTPNPMLGSQGLGLASQVRSFTDASMMSMNFMSNTPMGAPQIPQMNQAQNSIFTSYIPPPPLQTSMDDVSNNSRGFQQQAFSTQANNQHSNNVPNNGRQQRPNNNNNRFNQGNSNMNLSGNNGRARKRGRF